MPCRPLHLAIIHENTNLTQYLVKLIVGVYMNLDISNNMRQVSVVHVHVLTCGKLALLGRFIHRLPTRKCMCGIEKL